MTTTAADDFPGLSQSTQRHRCGNLRGSPFPDWKRIMDPTLTKAPCQSVSPRSVVSEHIGVKPGYYGGKPNILGHRFKVEHVVV